MVTTLAERIKKAMEGPPKVSGVAVAAACNITPTSVSDWRTGKSKTIEGANLLSAAKALRVRPDWLASGVGLMRDAAETVDTDAQTVVPYRPHTPVHDVWIREAISILTSLKPLQREGAVAALRTHVQNLGPPRDGQTLPMADKYEGAARVKKRT